MVSEKDTVKLIIYEAKNRNFGGSLTGLIIGKQERCPFILSKSSDMTVFIGNLKNIPNKDVEEKNFFAVTCFLEHEVWKDFLAIVIFQDHRAQVKFTIVSAHMSQ